MVLGWPFPIHVFDLHTAYLAASNILRPYNPDEIRKRERKGLSDACRAYGIEGWENIDKPAIAKAIAEGRWREYGKEAVPRLLRRGCGGSRRSCCAQQLRRHCDQRGHILLPAADVPRVLHWSNYSAKAVAQIQARGMPIDVPLWNLVQENKTSRHRRIAAAVRPELRQRRSDLHTRRRVELRAVRALARAFRRPLLAAPRERQARHRQRRLPHDEPHSRCGGIARAARQHRVHRQGAAADRA